MSPIRQPTACLNHQRQTKTITKDSVLTAHPEKQRQGFVGSLGNQISAHHGVENERVGGQDRVEDGASIRQQVTGRRGMQGQRPQELGDDAVVGVEGGFQDEGVGLSEVAEVLGTVEEGHHLVLHVFGVAESEAVLGTEGRKERSTALNGFPRFLGDVEILHDLIDLLCDYSLLNYSIYRWRIKNSKAKVD